VGIVDYFSALCFPVLYTKEIYMKSYRTVEALFIVLLTTIPGFAAEAVRGRWEKVEMLKPGTGIVVKLKAGDRVEGLYQGSNAEEFRIKNVSGTELSLPKQSILSIETVELKVKHNLRNGAVFGAVIGAPVGIVAAVIAHSSIMGGTSAWSSRDKQMVAAGALVTGGIGAGLGMLINSRNKHAEPHAELIYLAEKQ
jgi:hypothetical protein